MAEQTQWEYRAQRFGSLFREVKPEDLESTLDEWGAEGWEVVGVTGENNQLLIVAKRPLSLTTRRRRSMPGSG
jgi:hypothetical protein